MNSPSTPEKAVFVNRMFADIAHRYDLMNRLITGGRDVAWRREVVALCALPERGRLLDVGTGTGDIAYEAGAAHGNAGVTGCDFTFEMMEVGRAKRVSGQKRKDGENSNGVAFVQGDGLQLPFADGCFDAVTSGFLLRNVVDVDACLAEQRRVTRPGGRMVCLETSPPPRNLLSPVLRFYMLRVIPLISQLVAAAVDGPAASSRDRRKGYEYLPRSTIAFLPPEEMARRIRAAGFGQVRYRRKMFGSIAIYVGMA